MKALIYILVLFMQGYTTFAQLTVGSDATFYVAPQAMLQIKGDAINNGTFAGVGRVNLTGNWESTKKFEHSGEFALIGENQEISQNGGIFARLLVEGGGNKSFTSDAGIGKRLELTKGLVSPTSSAVFVLKDTAETSLGSSISYINGTLYREGMGDKYFPVGAGSLFAPVELHSINASAPTLGITLVNPNNEYMSSGKLVTRVMKEHYWSLTVKSGTYKDCNVTLPVFPEETSFYQNKNLSVLHAAAASGSYLSLAGEMNHSTRLDELHYAHVTSEKKLTLQYFTLGLAIKFDSTLLYIPNALSKHAPSEDDRVVKIYGGVLKAENFQFLVYNQWGNLVFETTSLEQMETKGWDGGNSNTGHRETTGKYDYVVKAEFLNGDIFQRGSSIFIID